MRRRICIAVIVMLSARHVAVAAETAAAFFPAAVASAGPAPADKPADKPEERKPPACMHCGATCGLAPVCVCEPGTKKRPKVEFEVTCEPICVAGCGGGPRFLDGHAAGTTCTGCREEITDCP